MIEADLEQMGENIERALTSFAREVEQAVTVVDVEAVLCEDGQNVMVYITLSSGTVTAHCLPMPEPA